MSGQVLHAGNPNRRVLQAVVIASPGAMNKSSNCCAALLTYLKPCVLLIAAFV